MFQSEQMGLWRFLSLEKEMFFSYTNVDVKHRNALTVAINYLGAVSPKFHQEEMRRVPVLFRFAT